ncbi:MAG TPA: type I DNA topoisomerase [Planctomycetota bacterium]|nr:type I DNA topoisomerase [Planctomycetota bacterium]
MPRKAALDLAPLGASRDPGAGPAQEGGQVRPKPATRSQKVPRGKPVVIVESPAKAKTINKILGTGFVVRACMGHIRDLPERAFGIKVENDFQPTYQTIKGKTKIVSELKHLTQQAETVYLAPDPDREGEAIAWHLVEALQIPKDRARRVTFNEITQRGVLEAFKHPGDISMPRVNAQQARRFLDRIVGYKLSPLLWKKVGRGLSAGRVQSVAVRLIVEREREIQAFKPEEYWRIVATLDQNGAVFSATLTKLEGKEIGLASESTPNRPYLQVSSAEQSKPLVEELKRQVFEIVEVRQRERQEPPPPPFTTSLLQQQASTQLHYSAKRTMTVAQQLYEGVELGSDGAIGLITYMRTDSFRIAGEALSEVRELIRADFGAAYVPERPVVRAARKGAQEAHEAIRPTYVSRNPDAIKPYLTEEQYRLYRLIWRRFVACQMKPARYLLTEAELRAGRATFAAKGRELQFDGFTALLGHALGKDEQILPPLSAGDRPALKNLVGKQQFTEPPARYTEASLVKALERNGIGRPSTYAPILSTIQERGYVRNEERKLHPTELGMLIVDKLVKHFNEIMEPGFTAKMEKDLDEIEDGGRKWTEVLRDFNDPFMKGLNKAKEEMESEKGQEAPGIVCEKCGKPMMIRWNKYGRFLGCAGYPECRSTKSQPSEEAKGERCDLCQAPMAIKSGRRGRFLACSTYPDCRGTKSLPRGNRRLEIPKDWKEACEKCGKPFRIRYGRRGGFIACAGFPDCKNTRRFPKDWYKDIPMGGEGASALSSPSSEDGAESPESESSDAPE